MRAKLNISEDRHTNSRLSGCIWTHAGKAMYKAALPSAEGYNTIQLESPNLNQMLSKYRFNLEHLVGKCMLKGII